MGRTPDGGTERTILVQKTGKDEKGPSDIFRLLSPSRKRGVEGHPGGASAPMPSSSRRPFLALAENVGLAHGRILGRTSSNLYRRNTRDSISSSSEDVSPNPPFPPIPASRTDDPSARLCRSHPLAVTSLRPSYSASISLSLPSAACETPRQFRQCGPAGDRRNSEKAAGKYSSGPSGPAAAAADQAK